MRAFLLTKTADITDQSAALDLVELPVPEIDSPEILIQVSACGVCHTELDEIEGRVQAKLPVVPGHQVVGKVVKTGSGTERFRIGDRVGVAWIHSACGTCRHCRAGFENLCPDYHGTGCDEDGGYAEFMKIDERFAYRIPACFSDIEAAPLLCAGAIGYRALEMTGVSDGDNLGLTGFGGSGHLVIQMAMHRYPNLNVFVFARNPAEREFALELGAKWAGNIDEKSPKYLQAVIDTTPVWKPVINGLANLAPGGRMIINAIRKETHDQEALLELDYSRHLWLEKEVKSVANITRQDVESFLALAAEILLRPHVDVYQFEDANRALRDLKFNKIQGAKVLKVA